MRREIDYRTYDPANFAADHPGDAVIETARDRATALARQVTTATLEGSPLDQQRYVHQGFDNLQSDLWDATDLLNRQELYKNLFDYKERLKLEVQQDGRAAVTNARRPEGEIAAWEGVPTETRRIDVMDMAQARAKDPAFDDRIEQLAHYQAARNEAASNEIDRIRQDVLKERGLDREDGSGSQSGPAMPPSPPVSQRPPEESKGEADEDAEKRSRIREALGRLDVVAQAKIYSDDRTPDMD